MSNRLFLNKIAEVCNNSYKPSTHNVINTRLRIEKIKKTPDMPFNKYCFCDLHELVNLQQTFNEMVLLQPLVSQEKPKSVIVPSICDDAFFKQEFDEAIVSHEKMLIHAILLATNQEYYKMDAMMHEQFIDYFIKQHNIVFDNTFYIENLIHTLSRIQSTNIIVLSVDGEISLHTTGFPNTIILVKVENEYFLVDCDKHHAYPSTHVFAKYLLEYPFALHVEEKIVADFPILEYAQCSPTFEEQTDSDHVIMKDMYVSDISPLATATIAQKPTKKAKGTAKLTNKDVFLANNSSDKVMTKIDERTKENETESSIFAETEVITKDGLKQLKATASSKMSLGELQNIATNMNILLAKGSTATGKPKLKTKKELLEEIEAVVV